MARGERAVGAVDSLVTARRLDDAEATLRTLRRAQPEGLPSPRS